MTFSILDPAYIPRVKHGASHCCTISSDDQPGIVDSHEYTKRGQRHDALLGEFRPLQNHAGFLDSRRRFQGKGPTGVFGLGFLSSLGPSFIKLAARFSDVRPVIPNPI
jgi:hypothetical protein